MVNIELSIGLLITGLSGCVVVTAGVVVAAANGASGSTAFGTTAGGETGAGAEGSVLGEVTLLSGFVSDGIAAKAGASVLDLVIPILGLAAFVDVIASGLTTEVCITCTNFTPGLR